MQEIEKITIRKVMRRLMPFLILCYFVAYLDRLNVGFAKLQMNAALGLSEAAYGLGAGIFFIAYFLFEVPSNLALARFGARRWIARIMVTWGLVSALFAFIQPIASATGFSNDTVFYTLRFVLGAAEAGLFPGVIYYLTLWFPSVYRARVIATFMLAIPFSAIVGAPLSGALLNIRGGGLDGWQWLFVIEAIPSIITSIIVLFYLDDSPRHAKWLTGAERDWLESVINKENTVKARAEHFSVFKSLTDRRVLLCAFVYFCVNCSSYGVSYFLPSIVNGFGVSTFQTGLLSAVPFLFGAVGMIVLGRRSDRTLKRREHLCFALLVAGLGVAAAGVSTPLALVLVFLCISQIGVSAGPPLMWPIPSSYLTGAAAASGIAMINALGNLAGFVGPYMMGYTHDQTGSYTAGLLILGAIALMGSLLALHLKVSSGSNPSMGASVSKR